jgi:hypothetical protein
MKDSRGHVKNYMRTEVITALNNKIVVFWDVALNILVYSNLFFPEYGGTKFLRNFGNLVSHKLPIQEKVYYLFLTRVYL